jgi:hypothetical protein
MAFCPARSSLSLSCHLKLGICGKFLQILILLPFLHRLPMARTPVHGPRAGLVR